MKFEREKNIARSIDLAWDSLKSHLSDVYDPIYPKLKERKAKDTVGDRKFHVKCVKEYAEIIKTLADQL
jgi:hypothetical protein